MNPIKELEQCNQSMWLDYMRKSLITSGELGRLVRGCSLRGVQVRPEIIEKVIAGSSEYDNMLAELSEINSSQNAELILEKLVIRDVQMAADALRPVYEDSEGKDGFISMDLGNLDGCSTGEIVEKARRVWKTVDRSNVLIKIPAIPEWLSAAEGIVASGINVNLTFLFSLAQVEAAAMAYLRGLEKCNAPEKVTGTASFHLSRLDTEVDKILESIRTPDALRMKGRIAVACARTAYNGLRDIFRGEPWSSYKDKGANALRLLWADTGVKNTSYSDTLYVEELIVPETIIAMPPHTLFAFCEHGRVKPFGKKEIQEASLLLQELKALEVDILEVSKEMQAREVASYFRSYSSLLSTVENKHSNILEKKSHQVLILGNYKHGVEERLESWKKINFIRRINNRDQTLWFSAPVPEISDRLGWMILPEIMYSHAERLISLADRVRNEGIHHLILLGMGGSSLAPEVFQKTFGTSPGYPELTVLDTTHPGAVRALEERIDLTRTLFLVSSKSGTTLETISLFRYFWEKVSQIDESPGKHFMAITDEDTPLMNIAQSRNFSHIFIAPGDVGGRFSALSFFGLVPAALIGVDIVRLIDRAWAASENCSFSVPERESSALVLGAALGEIAMNRDKLTLFTSPGISDFPLWLEQLIAESTGKDGKGIIPIVGEPFVPVNSYGKDRFFVAFFLNGDRNERFERQIAALEKKEHPVIRINLNDKYDLGREIYRWEFAVAAASAILKIHPFNQPDVQLAKELARAEMEEKQGKGMQEEHQEETISVRDRKRLAEGIRSWLGQAQTGDYVAINAYLQPEKKVTTALQEIRGELLRKTSLATTIGFGPRFLHSTGQLYKGGPNKGLFLQIVDEPRRDLSIPENYTVSHHSIRQCQTQYKYHRNSLIRL